MPGAHRWPMTVPRTPTRAEIGALGEKLAVAHLQDDGLQILDRNWRCRYGELDVVAECESETGRATLVFVEVKTRTGDGYGGLAEAVTPVKLRRLRRLAGLWLRDHDGCWSTVRIDVVGVRLHRDGSAAITHLRAVG